MKVTGFSFIRNAVQYQYPIKEALLSIAPLCNNMVVAVGNSTDDTRKEVIATGIPQLQILDTIWNEDLKEGGRVLADETDKAFQAITSDADWCFYIQGDEVLHEDGCQNILKAMQQYQHDDGVDGLLFKYRHFYGSFDYLGSSSRWYRNEIRVIKNNKNIYSYRDAQGFRKGDNQKLRVKAVDATIHHYGWVREPKAMQAKYKNSGRYWVNEAWSQTAAKEYDGAFDYSQVDALERYTGTHPQIMQGRIENMNWQFTHDLSYNNLKLKDRFKNALEKLTGKRPFDYKNYQLV